MNRNLIKLGIFLMVVSAVLLLTACGHDQPKKPLDDVVLVPKNETVNIPAKTLEPCKKLPRMEDRAYNQKEALQYANTLLTPVAECRDTKQDLIDSAKKAFNSK